MRNDLIEAGVEVMLDISNMKGDIDTYMIEGIKSCDKVLLVSLKFTLVYSNLQSKICTPQLSQRSAEPGVNNLQKELNEALKRQKLDPTFIIPLIFEGPRRDAIPKSLPSICYFNVTFFFKFI